MRRGCWMLALGWVLLGACSNKGSNTKIIVVVWSDLAVPTEMDNIRVDVTGSSSSPATTAFPLTAGNDGGATGLPVVMELVSPDDTAVTFDVVATGLLRTDPVVSRAARLSFDPGHSRVLTFFLARACMGATSGPCTQTSDVDVSTLPEYVPSKPFLPPDAGADVLGVADGSHAETGAADLAPDAKADGPPDGPLGSEVLPDSPSDPGLRDAADLGVLIQGDGAVETPVVMLDAGVDAAGDAPESGDTAFDAPPDFPARVDAGEDLAIPDGASGCVLPMTTCTGVCIDPRTAVGNCGGCGQACGTQNGTPACTAGACSMTSCAPGFLDCSTDENTSRDGCETNGNTDSANCGHCGNVCSSQVCRNQTCLATARYDNTGPGIDISSFETGFLAGIQVYLPGASVLTGFGAVLYNATASCSMYLGLYKDVAGTPGALVATVAGPTLVAPGGKEVGVPPVDVVAGTYWILGVWDGLASFATNTTTTTTTWRYTSYAYGPLPSAAPPSMTAVSLPPPNLYVIVAQ